MRGPLKWGLINSNIWKNWVIFIRYAGKNRFSSCSWSGNSLKCAQYVFLFRLNGFTPNCRAALGLCRTCCSRLRMSLNSWGERCWLAVNNSNQSSLKSFRTHWPIYINKHSDMKDVPFAPVSERISAHAYCDKMKVIYFLTGQECTAPPCRTARQAWPAVCTFP